MSRYLTANRRAHHLVATAVACLALCGSVTSAHAQICFHPPNPIGLPGLGVAMPQWPVGTTNAPATDPNLRNFVSDARWGDAPLEALYAVKPADPGDSAHYRVMFDPTTNKIAVSLQSVDGSGATTTSDFAYFGIADQTQQWAWGVRFALNGSGRHVPVDTSASTANTSWFIKSPTGWSFGAGLPKWVSNAALWVTTPGTASAPDGAATAAQFVMDLSQLIETGRTASIFPNGTAAIMAGMDYNLGGGIQPAYATPDLSVACPSGSGCFGTAPLGGNNPFLDDLTKWTPVSTIGAACNGISIDSSLIGASPCTLPANAGRSNCVQKGNGVSNTFTATPMLNGVSVTPGQLRAQFAMSNWGTVAQPTDWLTLGVDAPSDLNSSTSGAITATCSNKSDTQVCDQVITFTDQVTPGKRFHQCLQARLSTAAPTSTSQLTFQSASAYINTRFEPASVIDAPAQINIKGTPDTAPSQANRDVYLHVVTTNMPLPAADPLTLPVSSLEALRAQVDPTFKATNNGCPLQKQQCLSIGDGYGKCAAPCSGAQSNSCGAGYVATTYQNSCVCVPASGGAPYCVYRAPPVGGGYDPTKSALTPAQTLISQYPTFMVYPYYDTQQTVTIAGQTRKRVVAMPTFGIHAWHQGTFYGWLNGLVDSAGKPLQQVAPNIYKISVPKSTGLATIDVILSAEEQPHYDPLTDIAGSAVLGAGWGTFQLTATAHTTNIDLTKAKLTLQNLLGENATELVTSLKAPVVLTPAPGANQLVAVFTASSLPGATVTVTNLPLIGYVINFAIPLATVARPAACGLFFGSANLTTQFRLDDGTHPAVTLRGTDLWTCAPGVLLNY